MTLRVSQSGARSDTGLQRRANEDSFLERPPLFVVADGMGGARAGEVASRLAVEVFSAPLAIADAQPAEAVLARRVREANARIHELSQRDRDLHGMGTTITAVHVHDDEVSIAHVGDSRAYCLRAGVLTALTDDHSLVGELVRQGRLTETEASSHPQRSIITRALGPEPDVAVDTRTFRARDHDVFLLCSDGLTSMVSEAEIASIVARFPDLDDGARALIEAANAAGGNDNITVVLFALTGSEAQDTPVEPDDTGTEQPTTVGDPAMAAELSAALSSRPEEPPATTPSKTQPVPRRLPRLPETASAAARRRPRVPVTLLAVLAVLGLAGAGAFIASQTVYFVGTGPNGLVTLYRGLPYDLPAGIRLYTRNYVSGVGVASLAPARQRSLFNHRLRSHDDAVKLMRALELGQLSG